VAPVQVGHEDEGGGALLFEAPTEVAVQADVEGPVAVGAGGFDFDGEGLVTEVPLHEGRCYCILGSSSVDALAAAEAQAVRCWFAGDGIGPADLAGGIEHEEEEVALQVLEDGDDLGEREGEALGDALRAQGFALAAGEFGDGKIADTVMVGPHEAQARRGLMVRVRDLLAQWPGYRLDEVFLSANQDDFLHGSSLTSTAGVIGGRGCRFDEAVTGLHAVVHPVDIFELGDAPTCFLMEGGWAFEGVEGDALEQIA
jgi:hypothetical protein